MSELDIYLSRHYQTAEHFAFSCGITLSELSELIQQQLVPEPSYVITEHSNLISYVFGEMPAPDSTPGQYFHPANKAWVMLALSNKAKDNAADFKVRFLQNLCKELERQNKTLFRLADCFTDDGQSIPTGLASRTEKLWEHFLKGTFGLCIANPISEYEIIKKEILQEKLSALSANGAKSDFTESEKNELLPLIEEYAAASMPFSPIEYHRSSRKRLVEDLQKHLAEI